MLTHVDVGVMLIDPVTRRLRWSNRAATTACALAEPPPPDVVDHLSERVAPPDVARLTASWRRLTPGRPGTTTEVVRLPPSSTPSGTWTVTFTTLYRADDPDPLLAIYVQRPGRSTRPGPCSWAPPARLGERVLTVIDHTWHIRWAGPGLRRYGVDPEHVVGASALLAVHPEDVARVLAVGTDLLDGRRDRVEVRSRSMIRGDDWTEIDNVGTRIVGPDGRAAAAWTFAPADVEPTGDDAFLAWLGDGRATPLTADLVRRLASLTEGERVVVACVCRGLRAPDVGDRLGVAAGTVRNRLTAAYRKLGVTSQVELVELLWGARRDDQAPAPTARQ